MFIMQRVTKAMFSVVFYLIPFWNEEVCEKHSSYLKEIIFSLTKKAMDPEMKNPHLMHNFICVFETVHYCLQHHIVMLRDAPQTFQFKICFSIIEYIIQYIAKVNSPLGLKFRKYSFETIMNLLYSNDKAKAIAALIYLNNLTAEKDLFVENCNECLNGIFTILNRISCKFAFVIEKKARDLMKFIVTSYKASKKDMTSLRLLMNFLVRLIPTNKVYPQRILIILLAQVTAGLERPPRGDHLVELLLGEAKGEMVEFESLLNTDSTGEENSSPLAFIFNYVLSVLRSYRVMIQNKTQQNNGFKELVFDDCSKLTSVIIVLEHVFKWKIAYKIFDGNSFEPIVREILEILMEIIRENEEFNIKKMQMRGSSVRAYTKPPATNNFENELDEEARNNQQNYRTNTDIHYQNIEYEIYVDDYDFQIQGWSVLVETIINFLSSFMVKPEVHEYIKSYKELSASSDIFKIRFEIISKMFDLFSRVEFRIKESVERGFKSLLKVESNEKEIMPEDKLIACFRPLLACMQNPEGQDRKPINLNENTMHSFKKLFKLFKTCFNINKLSEKLHEYLKQSQEILRRESSAVLRDKEEEINQINSIFGLFVLISSKPC
jgi:hypothetical protein